jgi:glutamine amidotransferase
VIALIDYKAGNLTSVRKALAAIEADVFTPAMPDDLARAVGIIVPGVGHFGATRALDKAWVDAILDRIGEGVPLLGICLGMQWLYEDSEEAPELRGLGLLSGSCRKLRPAPSDPPIKLPHVGWNQLDRWLRPASGCGSGGGSGVLHTQLRRASHAAHRRVDGARRSVRLDRPTRTDCRCSISS